MEIGGFWLQLTPEQWLECLVCHQQFEVEPMFFGCPACAKRGRKAALEVRYDYDRIAGPRGDSDAPGMWRWQSLLPRTRPQSKKSLGEGNTPLLKLNGWSGAASFYVKNETSNPTWSYKDRANSVSVSMACEFGFPNVVAVSTGNHGNAAAAYSAAAGRRCVVFCHPDAPESQLALMAHYGATVIRGGRQAAMVQTLVTSGEWFPSTIFCPRDGLANPYGIEGFKTIAFEIVEQLGRVPDRLFVPVGSGDGIYGIWKGFVEMVKTGRTDALPRLHACQSTGANPYVRAFRAGARRLTAVDSARTIALSIAEKIGGEQSLLAIYESQGEALEVDDQEIMKMTVCLAHQGLALEAASATAVACAQQIADTATEGEIWVAIGTGSIVKWPQTFTSNFVCPVLLPPDFESVEQLIPAANEGIHSL
jgi:threonine synthase